MTSEYIEKIIESEFQRVTTMDSDCSIADGAMGVAGFVMRILFCIDSLTGGGAEKYCFTI